MPEISFAELVNQTLSAAKAAAQENLDRATRNKRVVDTAAKDKLVAAVMEQIYEDGARGWGDRDVKVALGQSRESEAVVSVRSAHFNYDLPVSELQRAVEAIPDEEPRKLLGRAGILPVVTQILDKAPDSTITLSDHSRDKDGGRSAYYKATTIDFDVNAHPVQVEVLQDIRHTHTSFQGPRSHAPLVYAYVRETPEVQTTVLSAIGGSNSGRPFNIMGGTNVENYHNPGLKGFGEFLEGVKGLSIQTAIASDRLYEQRPEA